MALLSESLQTTAPQELKGMYTFNSETDISDCKKYIMVTNRHDDSEYIMKVSTYLAKVNTNEYIEHEDGSFDKANDSRGSSSTKFSNR